MIKESIHNLPAPLVIILVFSLLAAVVSGLGLRLAGVAPATDKFMPQRLVPDEKVASLDPARMQGIWSYVIDDNKVMTIRFEKDVFEWVVKPSEKSTERIFARGNFRSVGNVLILAARDDMGKPVTTLLQSLTFYPLDLHNINLRATENGRLMVWTVPVSERRKMNSALLGLFPVNPDKPMTWVRIGS